MITKDSRAPSQVHLDTAIRLRTDNTHACRFPVGPLRKVETIDWIAEIKLVAHTLILGMTGSGKCRENRFKKRQLMAFWS
jgi:hypothetical protein